MTGLRDWWDDRSDRKRDLWDPDRSYKGRRARLRWWVARQVDRLPGQCWADLADFGLGKTTIPWEPRSAVCTEDAQRCGTCYCGKVLRADLVGQPDLPQYRVVVPTSTAQEGTP